jgi:hypothetical protein
LPPPDAAIVAVADASVIDNECEGVRGLQVLLAAALSSVINPNMTMFSTDNSITSNGPRGTPSARHLSRRFQHQ